MSQLIDDEGNVHTQSPFTSGWRQKQGAFGPAKDTNIFGQPNVKRDLLGRPVVARDGLGRVIRDGDEPLYEPASPSSFEPGGGDAEAMFIFFIVIIVAWVVSALFALLGKMAAALIETWRELERRYPRAMLIVRLVIGMVAIGYALGVVGFDLRIQLAGIALVPGLWGWLWLTRRVPAIFLPINGLLAGGILWLSAEVTRSLWLTTWSRLTVGLPLLGNLSIVLAVLPTVLLLLETGRRRWPKVFTPINLLVIGVVTWFLLMRAWTAWIPFWAEWTAPIPIMPPVGWLVLLAPLALWLWREGQARWPLPFFAGNLLLLGSLLGLTAYHTQPAWIETWGYWTAGLPFASVPIAVIGLSPVTLWGWSRLSHQWPRALVIPNLLITSGILWLILHRIRPLWIDTWSKLWGDVPLTIDLAILVAVLPLTVWALRQSKRHLPRLGEALRVILLGALLWWVVERTRVGWQKYWQSFVRGSNPDLALLAGITPLLLWSWAQLKKIRPQVSTAIALAVVSPGLAWIIGLFSPASTPALRIVVAVIPWIVWGWSHLLRRRPRLGWALVLLPLVGLGLLAWLTPSQFRALVAAFLHWLTEQGVPLPTGGM